MCRDVIWSVTQTERERQLNLLSHLMIVGPPGNINAISFPLNAVVEKEQGLKVDWGLLHCNHTPVRHTVFSLQGFSISLMTAHYSMLNISLWSWHMVFCHCLYELHKGLPILVIIFIVIIDVQIHDSIIQFNYYSIHFFMFPNCSVRVTIYKAF